MTKINIDFALGPGFDPVASESTAENNAADSSAAPVRCDAEILLHVFNPLVLGTPANKTTDGEQKVDAEDEDEDSKMKKEEEEEFAAIPDVALEYRSLEAMQHFAKQSKTVFANVDGEPEAIQDRSWMLEFVVPADAQKDKLDDFLTEHVLSELLSVEEVSSSLVSFPRQGASSSLLSTSPDYASRGERLYRVFVPLEDAFFIGNSELDEDLPELHALNVLESVKCQIRLGTMLHHAGERNASAARDNSSSRFAPYMLPVDLEDLVAEANLSLHFRHKSISFVTRKIEALMKEHSLLESEYFIGLVCSVMSLWVSDVTFSLHCKDWEEASGRKASKSYHGVQLNRDINSEFHATLLEHVELVYYKLQHLLVLFQIYLSQNNKEHGPEARILDLVGAGFYYAKVPHRAFYARFANVHLLRTTTTSLAHATGGDALDFDNQVEDIWNGTADTAFKIHLNNVRSKRLQRDAEAAAAAQAALQDLSICILDADGDKVGLRIPAQGGDFAALKEMAADELGDEVSPDDISKFRRKSDGVVIKNDRHLTNLKNGDELEVVMAVTAIKKK